MGRAMDAARYVSSADHDLIEALTKAARRQINDELAHVESLLFASIAKLEKRAHAHVSRLIADEMTIAARVEVFREMARIELSTDKMRKALESKWANHPIRKYH